MTYVMERLGGIESRLDAIGCIRRSCGRSCVPSPRGAATARCRLKWQWLDASIGGEIFRPGRHEDVRQREPRNLAFCVRPTRHVRCDGAIIQPQRPLPSFQPIALTDTGCASVASPSRRWSCRRSLCRIGGCECLRVSSSSTTDLAWNG